HRFWLQAEEVDCVNNTDEDIQKTNIKKFAFGNIKIVVHTHRMVPNEKGELVDTEDSLEGWNMYAIPIDRVSQQLELIQSPAMIWVDKNQVCFYEQGTLSKPFHVKGYKNNLYKLFQLERNESQ